MPQSSAMEAGNVARCCPDGCRGARSRGDETSGHLSLTRLALPSPIAYPWGGRGERSTKVKQHFRGGLAGLAGVVTLLVLAACGSAATAIPTPVSPKVDAGPAPILAPTPELSGKMTAVDLRTDFSIEAYQGEDVLGGKNTQFSGLFGRGQPVVLNFFAGLCPPCRAEMPDLQSVSAQYQGRVTLFGLDIGPFMGLGSQKDGKALVQEMGVTYPTGAASDSKVDSLVTRPV